jgi:hypothetical protein
MSKLKIAFPPYGRMMSKFELMLPDPPAPPKDWNSPGGWLAWRKKFVELISAVVWPRYDRDTASWVGASAQRMLAMTRDDFDIIKKLRATHDATIELPEGLVPHSELFVLEDEGDVAVSFKNVTVKIDRSVDRTLRMYLATKLPPHVLDEFASLYIPTAMRKAGTIHVEFKPIFQRPRPYQMAYILGED